MLLTSSQVGIVLSSFIIIFFTSALFFAGYFLQQNTLNHLRAAIKPKPFPVHSNLYNPNAEYSPAIGASPSAREDGPVPDQLIEVILQNNNGRPGWSDDELTWAERRKAETVQAKRESKMREIADKEIQSVAVTITEEEEDEIKREAEKVRAVDQLSSAARRKQLRKEIEQYAPEHGFKNPFDYRRRSWLTDPK